MERLRVAVPWNQPSYISANGFHPLYRPLFDCNPLIEFCALDDAALARELERDSGLHRAMVARRDQLRGELPAWFSDNAVGRQFLWQNTLDEMVLTEAIPCDMELHHSTPCTSGRRPFALLCESFSPLFRTSWHGSEALNGTEALRSFYTRLFEADTCLGIFSHVPATLEQFRRFFSSEKIDAKLKLSPIGICERDLEMLLATRRAVSRAPSFLFIGSPDDSSGRFAQRGGAAALKFAELYFRSGRHGFFFFWARRPSDTELAAIGVDVPFISGLNHCQIAWVEDHLSSHESLRLLSRTDFVLLLGRELQSVMIMQALAAGAVPIASNTTGLDVLIEDDVSGILLKATLGVVSPANDRSNAPNNAMCLPSGLDALLAWEMLQRVKEVLRAPGRLQAMRTAGQEIARNRFSGMRFRNVLSEAICQLWRERDSGCRESTTMPSSPLRGRALFSSGNWERYFSNGSPSRLVIDAGAARVYATRGVYYFLPTNAVIEQSPWTLSTLTLKSRGILGPSTVRIAVEAEGLNESIFLALSRSRRWVGRLRYFRLGIVERGKFWLRRYRRIYRLARGAYRLGLRTMGSSPRRNSGRS